MSILLDGLMILLFVWCALSGWTRGFVKAFSGLIALTAAMVVSSLLAAPVAQAVAQPYAVPLPLSLLYQISSTALFVLAYILTRLLLRWLDILAKLPLIHTVNKVLGLVVGALSGVLWVLFAMGVVTALARSGWIPALTPAALEETRLISWLATTASTWL